MSLIFVLGNIGGALASAVTGISAGAGTAALGGTGAALGGAGAAGAAGTTTAGLFGGTSLAGLAGAPTGVAAGAGAGAGATGVPGEVAATAALNSDKAALASQATSGLASNASAASPATLAPGASTAAPGAGTITGSTTGDMIGGTLLTSGGQQLAQAKGQADATTAQNKGYRQLSAQQAGESAEALKDVRNTLGGGLMLAEGGGVNLQSGQFVIPADIVSDLGNGDTKAGMEFLKQFFETGGHA